MDTKLKILEVKSAFELKKFINFPLQLYRKEKKYVPQLFLSQKQLLSKKHNPFFEHSQATYYLFFRNNETVGRIALIENTIHNKTYNEKTAHFGMFDVVNNFEISKKMFYHLENIAKSKGYNKLVGPVNLTTNDSAGILTDGFNFKPHVLMPYNFLYYKLFLEKNGYSTSTKLFAFVGKTQTVIDNLKPIADRIEPRLNSKGIFIRNISFKNFDEDIEKLHTVYNLSNKKNWGFVPLTKNEFRHMANNLRQIVPKEFVKVVEYKRLIIGYLIAVPDINQILIKIKNGKLFPFGIIKLLTQKKNINSARVLILGVDEKYRNLGIDVCLYCRNAETMLAHNMPYGEAGYVMQTNKMMQSLLKKMGGTLQKEYEIYYKNL